MYKHISRADEYKADKTAYDAWLAKSRADKQTAYKNQVAATGNKRSDVNQELGYIFPFGILQTKKILLGVNVVMAGTNLETSEESAATLITKIRSAVVGAAKYSNIPGTGFPAAGSFTIDSRRKKIRPAKVKLVRVGAKVEGIRSRYTNRPYSYRKKDSVSCSFGQLIGTETSYETAVQDLRTVLGTDGDKVYFTPQGNIDIAAT